MLDPHEVDAALEIDPTWVATVRSHWTSLIALAVLGDLKTQQLGALPRLRKKVLDLGERLRSAVADRAWIPQPRDRLKNALASALALRESLAQVEAGAADIDGGDDRDRLRAALAAFAAAIDTLEPRMNAWATLLARRPEEDDNSSPA